MIPAGGRASRPTRLATDSAAAALQAGEGFRAVCEQPKARSSGGGMKDGVGKGSREERLIWQEKTRTEQESADESA